MKLFSFFFLFFLSLPGICQEDDEKMIEALQAERKKQTEVAVQIHKTNEKVKEAVLNIPYEMKKLGYEAFNIAALGDERVIDLMQKALKQSPLKSLPPEKVNELILAKAEGTMFHGYLSDSPKLLNVLSELLRDEKALPNGLRIFQRKDDLKYYFFIWIGFMILSWLFKKIFFSQKWSKRQVTAFALVVNLSFTAASFSTFYYIFYDELTPATKIIWSHWRKRNL